MGFMHIASLRKRITSWLLVLKAALKEPLSLKTVMLHKFRVFLLFKRFFIVVIFP